LKSAIYKPINRLLDNGTGVAGYRKFVNQSLCQGTFFICLLNDNMTLGIDATVKVSAIVEVKYFEDRVYTEQKVSLRYEKKIFKEPIITTFSSACCRVNIVSAQ
jgi:hypothetical protein